MASTQVYIPKVGPAKGKKIAPTCRHWQNGFCKRKADCQFRHPTTPCNDYPNCKFSDVRCQFRHKIKRCAICQEFRSSRVRFTKAVQTKYVESYTMAHCAHQYCTTCLLNWVRSSLTDGRRTIECPNQDCTAAMDPSDVMRIEHTHKLAKGSVPRYNLGMDLEDMAKRFPMAKAYADQMAMQYAERLKDIVKVTDKDNLTWIHTNARTCPSCSVIVFKDQGCDTINCRCGVTFCFSSAPKIPTEQEKEKEKEKEEAAAEASAEASAAAEAAAEAAASAASAAEAAEASAAEAVVEAIAALSTEPVVEVADMAGNPTTEVDLRMSEAADGEDEQEEPQQPQNSGPQQTRRRTRRGGRQRRRRRRLGAH
eukprot:m.68196 g.68196  ORF g.68196 m.68196 type:complete len:367 (+) comp12190_c0_seq1:324-1424(+)